MRVAPEYLGLTINSADHRASPVHGRRRADYFLPDRRAARLARLWQIGKQKLRVWPFPY
jgi:hypothetical protein